MTTMKPSPSPDQIAERELAAFLATQDPLDVAAADWHTRREQAMTDADEAAFQQWLAADPAHAASYARLDQGVRMVRSLPAERTRHLRARAPTAAPARSEKSAGAWLAAALRVRTTRLALCCVALLAIGAGWHQWQQQPTFTESYASARGQRLDVALPDGSKLVLDTDTRLDVALYRDHRLVRLARGQAMFSVAPDASRPFDVLAGPARVTVLGTRFSVRRSAEVDVEVEEGHVKVAQADHQRSDTALLAAELHAGQAIHVSAAGMLGEIAPVKPGSIALWRKGLVRFASTPLADAVQELERYGPSKLVIRDPDVAAMPIGGSYRTDNPAAFAQVLPMILPVRLVPRADGMHEVVKKN
jgi:transmembrane sensor